MKKIAMLVGVVALLASCTISRSIQLTGKPIGTKKGVAKSSIIGNSDFSLKKAAKNGNVKTIGAVEVTTKVFILPFITTKVYGE